MAQGITGTEWLNQNSLRSYPISEEATALDLTGSFKLPESFIVDLLFPVHSTVGLDIATFHILSVGIFGTGITVSLGQGGVLVGSVSIDAVNFTPNQSFFIAGVGSFPDSVGKITIGSLEEILKFAGSFTFDVAGGRLEPTVIRPDIRGITGLTLINNGNPSDLLQGDVVFQAGTNFRLVVTPAAPGVPARIRFDAIEGAGLSADCDCTADQEEVDPIRTINGIGPDIDGNFTLLGDDCIKLAGIENGIEMDDDCSKPCCGCSELEIVIQDMQNVLNQVITMESFAERLEGVITQLNLNVLASKTNAGF